MYLAGCRAREDVGGPERARLRLQCLCPRQRAIPRAAREDLGQLVVGMQRNAVLCSERFATRIVVGLAEDKVRACCSTGCEQPCSPILNRAGLLRERARSAVLTLGLHVMVGKVNE